MTDNPQTTPAPVVFDTATEAKPFPNIIAYATRAERIEVAMHKLIAPIPSTKGMGPKDRAQRLHAELERRIGIASEALKFIEGDRAYE